MLGLFGINIWKFKAIDTSLRELIFNCSEERKLLTLSGLILAGIKFGEFGEYPRKIYQNLAFAKLNPRQKSHFVLSPN